jgi:palmitoyltransferase
MFLVRFFKQRTLASILASKQVQRGSAEYLSARNEMRERLGRWINKPTKNVNGFTPLHYASFHGDHKVIKYLVKNGANMQALNPDGMGMMHLAAQGDQPYSLTYFKTYGLSIDAKDFQSSTPLLWAFQSVSILAIYYLLGWEPELDA